MGELFEGLFGIIIIIAAIARLGRNAKKVQQNAPGQTGRPPQNTAPVQPPASRGSFWEQVMDALDDELDDESKNRPRSERRATVAPAPAPTANRTSNRSHTGHEAVGSLAEGASRECDYGSIGGSMAYTHSDGAQEMRRTTAVESIQSEQSAARPAMTAEQMRQAIVMAEILKRPQERMAEQARRWNRQ